MKKNWKSAVLIFLLSLCILFFSCATLDNNVKEFYTDPQVLPENTLFPETIAWEEVEKGFQKTNFHIESLKVSWTAIKIDLDTENLQFDIEPKKENPVKKFNVKSYAKSHKAILAVNTTPFDLGKTDYPIGITKFDYELITSPVEKYCALKFSYTEDGKLRASIVNHQTEEAFDDCFCAIGGFYTIYEDNKIYTFAKNKRSRTGCGISDDGRYLYFMVCTPDFNFTDRNGLNYEECALIFRKLGCYKAMEFDGGHSSALVFQNKDIEKPIRQRKVPGIIIFFKE